MPPEADFLRRCYGGARDRARRRAARARPALWISSRRRTAFLAEAGEGRTPTSLLEGCARLTYKILSGFAGWVMHRAVVALPPTRTPPTFQDSSEPSRLARRVRLTALAERSAQADSLPNSERPSDPTTRSPALCSRRGEIEVQTFDRRRGLQDNRVRRSGAGRDRCVPQPPR